MCVLCGVFILTTLPEACRRRKRMHPVIARLNEQVSIRPFVQLSRLYLCVCMFIRPLPVYLVCLFFCFKLISIYFFVCLSVCLSVCVSIGLAVCLSVCQYIYFERSKLYRLFKTNNVHVLWPTGHYLNLSLKQLQRVQVYWTRVRFCLSVCLSICLFIRLSGRLHVYPFLCPSVYPSVTHPSVCLFICVYPSVYPPLFIRLFIRQSVYPPVHSSVSVWPSVCLSVCFLTAHTRQYTCMHAYYS